METNQDFAAPCGLYCGVCAIYIAHRDDNQRLKQGLVNLYQGKTPDMGTLPGSENLTTEDIKCQGCMSDEPFAYCRQCKIKDCTQEKGYSGCHQCDEFPCEHIDNFPMAVGKKVILRATADRREVGTEQWMQDEEARYVCPQCGNKVFRGAFKCTQCHTALDLD